MKEYVFVFGRDKELSLLEIISFLEAREVRFEIVNIAKEAIFLKIENLDFEDSIKKLGGIVKIGEIIDVDNFEFKFNKNKVKIGASVYGNYELLRKFKEKVKSIAKKEKIKIIWKKGTNDKVEPSKVVKEKLLEEGYEFLIFGKKVARTIAVSNPLEYEIRDKERPRNDFLKSISIRMAKIMINLSEAKKNDSVLDPFCGIGIILQEALLMNIDVLGLDLDKKSVSDSIENCKWIKKKFNIRNNFNILNGDATRIDKHFKDVKYVVTEPYLGPYLRKVPARKEALKIINELSRLYRDFFNSLDKIMKKGRIVIIMPKFRDVGVDMDNLLRDTKIKRLNNKHVKLPIEYAYKESKIFREIYVLGK